LLKAENKGRELLFGIVPPLLRQVQLDGPRYRHIVQASQVTGFVLGHICPILSIPMRRRDSLNASRALACICETADFETPNLPAISVNDRPSPYLKISSIRCCSVHDLPACSMMATRSVCENLAKGDTASSITPLV
jgi:hypothetical protein